MDLANVTSAGKSPAITRARLQIKLGIILRPHLHNDRQKDVSVGHPRPTPAICPVPSRCRQYALLSPARSSSREEDVRACRCGCSRGLLRERWRWLYLPAAGRQSARSSDWAPRRPPGLLPPPPAVTSWGLSGSAAAGICHRQNYTYYHFHTKL